MTTKKEKWNHHWLPALSPHCKTPPTKTIHKGTAIIGFHHIILESGRKRKEKKKKQIVGLL